MFGEIGHISIIVAWVAALVVGVSYYLSLRSTQEEAPRWKQMARYAFVVHVGAIVSAVFVLFQIIYQHQYAYHYAWKHSSNALPVYYVASCFWEGQEGSFLVWIFWNALIGLALIRTARVREAGVMTVLAVGQGFLLAMILGVYVGEWKIGSSAFSLLKDVLDDPVYQIDPTFVPEDGTGLNPLLQNIWMVIHPPIIFLGFALSLVPFAYAVAGLMQRDYRGWLPKAAIWTGLTVAVMGLGIMMGAYWAYETLNFGGYWNWDPVENAILIPWLVFVGAMHGMVVFKRKTQGLFFTTILTITGFVLVVYSTFLTRSGILGDSSVHSFTDLGLSGQLLIFLLVTVGVSVGVLIKRYSAYKVPDDPLQPQGVHFWVVAGISILCLSAFQVLIPTSIPVFSAILNGVGLEVNMAPPADPVAFYNKFQIWFALLFGLVMGTAQLIYWRRVEGDKPLEDAIAVPIMMMLVFSSVIIGFSEMREWQFMLLVISTTYGICACLYILYQEFGRAKWKLGGPFAHLGFALMIMGFVFSAGYSTIVSKNLSINAPDSSLPIHTIQENALLNRNQTKAMGEYQVTYLGVKAETYDRRNRIDQDVLLGTNYEDYKVLKSDYEDAGRLFLKGDTVRINTENIYYTVAIEKDGRESILEPRMQNNPTMGFIASPDVHSFWDKDIYLHVSNFPDQQKQEWSRLQSFTWSLHDTVDYMGIKVAYQGTEVAKDIVGVDQSKGFTLASAFSLIDGDNEYELNPLYQIKGGDVRLYPESNTALGLQIVVDRIDPKSGSVSGHVRSSQRDWITIKAKEMPYISLVWMGTIVMVMGVMMAVVRRIKYVNAREEWVPMAAMTGDRQEKNIKTKIKQEWRQVSFKVLRKAQDSI